MAAKKETAIDTEWEKMKDLAMEQQQYFYEYLSDCMIYKSDEHKYLQQNIGFAIYGPPTSNKDTTKTIHCYYKENSNNADTDITDSNTDITNSNTDITDSVDYDEKAKKVIDKIYNKICDHSIQTDSQPIYCGIIYVIIFRPKRKVKQKRETKVEEKEKTKVKQATETEVKDVKENEVKDVKENEVKDVKENEEKLPTTIPLPIFTIRRSIQKTSNTTKNTEQEENVSKTEADYETWYIDTNGKVFKSWTDFVKYVDFPKCTMVVPKDGIYQANPSFPITEDYCTVWIEIMDSPACALKAQIIKGVDIASTVVGVGTIGVGIASLFTPIAPVVAIAGFVAAGTSGTWTTGRSVQQLIRRNKHEESISLLDKEAFPHYLGIAGTALGLGAMGGSVALSSAAARGMIVPNYAKIAFNTVQGGNILLNGVGVAYQGYYIIDKYLTEDTYSILDTLYFATHLMFFAGSVIKLQFANDIIKSAQGKVLNDYKEGLQNKRLRKKFNHAARKAAERNTCKISENADVISYINNREQLQVDGSQSGGSRTLDKTSNNIVWSIEQGKIKVSGILLLDPIKFVIYLIQSGKLTETNQSNRSQNNSDDLLTDQLGRVLCNLLTKYCTSNDCLRNKKLPTSPDFEPLLREMGSLNIDEESLKKLFNITVKLIKRSKDKEEFLLQSFTFIWQYCKENLNKWGIKSFYYTHSTSRDRVLQKIIIVLFEAINMILDNFYSAFLMYVEAKLHS